MMEKNNRSVRELIILEIPNAPELHLFVTVTNQKTFLQQQNSWSTELEEQGKY